MDRVSPPEAATRLYPNVLNALAHDNAGLAAVSRIASACSAWRVRFSSLAEAVAGIRRIVADANA